MGALAPPLSSVGFAGRPPLHDRQKPTLALGFVLLGLVLLYAPVLWEYGARFFWNEDDNHSGLLLILVLWAYWRDRDAFRPNATEREFVLGSLIVLLGLFVYIVGCLTDFLQLQGVSLPLLVTGLTLAIGGMSAVRRWWLLSLLLVFIVPWFGPVADIVLIPLRLALTGAAAHFVNLLGFPVSSSGVFIYVGFVQLNVAGACVGLRAMVSMTAIGVLFLHFFPPRSFAAGIIFILLLPVIALIANFLRVSGLVITTALFGVGGEAFVHDFAAYSEVIVALFAFLLLGKLFGKKVSAA